jgi:FkbH-like protein
MTGEHLLSTLASRSVRLNSSDGRLRFQAPEGAMDQGLREAIQEHKDSLLAALEDRAGFLQMCPLSCNQLSLFFLHLLDPKTPAYNLAIAVRFRSAVDSGRLRKAVEHLVRRHGQLRTTYSSLPFADTIVHCQLTAEYLPPGFEEHDATSLDEQGLLESVRSFYSAPIDLEAGPIVQAALFKQGEEGGVLVVKLHHIAADGWSLNLIARDLGGFYRDPATGNPASDNEEAGTYTEFSLQQREFLSSPDGLKQLGYWKNIHAHQAAFLQLGPSDGRPAFRRPVGATRRFEIDEAECAALNECAKRLGITAFALLLAAFQAFLMRRCGQADIVTGIPTLGNRGGKFGNTVGYFVNPVALRCRRALPIGFGEHARLTMRELSGALDNRDAPFAIVVERMGGARDPSRTAVFQVLFNVLSAKTLGEAMDLLYGSPGGITVDFCGMKAEAYPIDQQEGQFDLTLELIDRGRYLTGLFKYCTDLFAAEEAAGMLRDFRELLRNVATDPDGTRVEEGGIGNKPAQEVVVAATFTADTMRDPFEFWFARLGWRTGVVFSQFNQVFQALLDPSSVLRQARAGYGVILIRFDDMAGPLPRGSSGSPDSSEPLTKRLASNLDELIKAVEEAARAAVVPLCVVFCPSSPRFREMAPEEFRLREDAAARLESIRGVHALTAETLFQWFPLREYYEPLGEELGHMPYTKEFFCVLATGIVRSLHAMGKKPLKALVVDCDGTLWEGVAAEDGPDAVVIGAAQIRIQEFLIEQSRKGVVLCICSKNRESDVWAVFDGRPEMALKRRHVPFWRIDWRPKSVNVRELAFEIGIDLDAIAFLDDNPLEREEVHAACPSVLCVDLPAEWEDRVPYLRHLWPLDNLRVTEDDRKRNEYYGTERLRDELRAGAESFSGFLDRLGLEVDLGPAEPADHERLAQLSVRVNQFSTTGRRMTARDVAEYGEAPGHSVFAVRARDRFGDYGLVGAVFASVSGKGLRVDSLLLSCRALGRGVEYRMAAGIARFAASAGCSLVEFPFLPTERNEPARAFLESIGESCQAASDRNGTLQVAVGVLLNARFTPQGSPKIKPGKRTVHAAAGAERPVWDERVVSIAAELRAADRILSAVEEWRVRAKPAPRGGPGGREAPKAPVSDVERLIADSWKRALVVEEVGTGDNFFDIGGTSILLAQVAVDLGRRGLEISMADMFRYPTIAALSRRLGRSKTDGDGLEATISHGERQRAALEAHGLPAAFRRLKHHRGK